MKLLFGLSDWIMPDRLFAIEVLLKNTLDCVMLNKQLGALIILLLGSSIRGIAVYCPLSSDPVCIGWTGSLRRECDKNRKEIFATAKVRVTVKVAVKRTVKRRIHVVVRK